VARVPTRTIALHVSRLGGGRPSDARAQVEPGLLVFPASRRARDAVRVTLYDLRGHGTSEGPDSGYTARDMAGDLKALMDAKGIESAHLVGHSFEAPSPALRGAPSARVRSLALIDSRLHALQPFDSPGGPGVLGRPPGAHRGARAIDAARHAALADADVRGAGGVDPRQPGAGDGAGAEAR
jgi:pimeloyl-ACP methyl ester carboxylesterase